MEDIIEVENLTKKFGHFTAVDNISFKVKKGEIFGFLGPNGAGKSTTIRMLTTLLRPTSGRARIAGYDLEVQQDQVRRYIGLVAEKIILYDRLTADENLQFFGRLNNLKPAVIKERSDRWLRRLGMEEWRNHQVGTYSTGMKQRINVVRALLTEPDILFLDEPTLGLDPQTSRLIRDFIAEVNETGATVILTTHDMNEAETLSDRVAIIDCGKIIALNSTENLKKMVKNISNPTFEDVFLTLTGNKVRDIASSRITSASRRWHGRPANRVR